MSTPLPHTELISITEAGRRTGLHRQTVLRWVREGKLGALRLGREWRVWVDELDWFAENRRQEVTKARFRSFMLDSSSRSKLHVVTRPAGMCGRCTIEVGRYGDCSFCISLSKGGRYWAGRHLEASASLAQYGSLQAEAR